MSTVISELHEGTIEYCFTRALLVPTLDWDNVHADALVGQQICRLYEQAPLVDGSAEPAYEAMRQEIRQQFGFLTRPAEKGGLGVEAFRVEDEPYSQLSDLTADLCQHRRIRVRRSAGDPTPHPFFTGGEYDMFRAVHEAFGHAAIQAEFDLDGLERAWLKHSTMFTPLARRALATETRAQTYLMMFSTKLGAKFPLHKIVLLPPEYSLPDYEDWR